MSIYDVYTHALTRAHTRTHAHAHIIYAYQYADKNNFKNMSLNIEHD